MTTQQIAPALELTRLGGTIRLTQQRADGGTLEMSLTRGAERTTAMYAVTYHDGTLRAMTARSWANGGPEPEMGAEIGEALELAQRRSAHS